MIIKNIRVRSCSIGAILIFATWPPIAMLYVTVGFVLQLIRTSFSKILVIHFISVILFSLIVIFSFITSTIKLGSADPRDLKFIFYILALSFGFSLRFDNYLKIFNLIFIFFTTFLMIQLYVFGWGPEVRGNGVFYLPDQNNSMTILAFLFPAVLANYEGKSKLLIGFVGIFIMFLIGSRAGMAIVLLTTILSLLNRPSLSQVLLLIPIFILPIYFSLSTGLIDVSTFFEFNNYSDQVRLILWSVGISEFLASSNYFVGLGYNFTHIYSLVLDHEMKHVHNIYLQVLLTSGLIGFFSILSFFFSWLYFSIKQGNYLLFYQVAIVMVLGMVETLYSDSRVFVLICFLLGLSFKSFKRKNI